MGESLETKLHNAIATMEENRKQYAALSVTIAELAAQEVNLEASIKVKEATELMNLGSDGKNMVCVIDGKQIALTNDKLRDAYRRLSTVELRNSRAFVQSQLASLREQQNALRTSLMTFAPFVEGCKLIVELKKLG